MTYKSDLGNIGEDIACKYLGDKKYKTIHRNFRKPWGEIDIIAKAPDKTLVFIEVKTVRDFGEKGVSAEEQLSQAKLKKLQKTASLYTGHYPDLVDDEKRWRIDLVAITISDLANPERNCDIRHYKNI